MLEINFNRDFTLSIVNGPQFFRTAKTKTKEFKGMEKLFDNSNLSYSIDYNTPGENAIIILYYYTDFIYNPHKDFYNNLFETKAQADKFSRDPLNYETPLPKLPKHTFEIIFTIPKSTRSWVLEEETPNNHNKEAMQSLTI